MGRLAAERAVVVQHRRNDRLGHPHVPKIENIVRIEVERGLGILDVGEDDVVPDA